MSPNKQIQQQQKNVQDFIMQSMLTTYWEKYPILNISLLKSADVWKSSIRFDKNRN